MKTRLKAGVLSFTIYVSVIVAILLSMLIMFAYYADLERTNYRIGLRLLDNLSSVEQWILSEGDRLVYGEGRVFDLFGDETDSVAVKRGVWGLYDLYEARSFFRHQQKQSKFLVGQQLTGRSAASLYLQDQSRDLNLAGEALLQGDVYLPNAQVSTGYVDRVGYLRNKLVYGNTYKSDQNLPEIDVRRQISAFKNQISKWPQVLYAEEADEVKHSFWSDGLMVLDVGDYMIEGSLSGFILIKSSGRVVVTRNAHTEQIVVMANQIEFEKGFSGQGQFFATDTIIVEEDVELLYPSVLYLDNPEKQALIEIQSSATVNGTIILTGSDDNFRDRLITVEDEAMIIGSVYCNGHLTTYGQHNGHVFARMFLINGFTGIFENYILNATFKNDLDPEFLVPINWFGNSKKGILQWVY